ncbi:hypothetical protein DZC34_02580 [Clostridium botulinum]|nr:hypothetical protein DZC34_02580 [Clostridium botulinum]
MNTVRKIKLTILGDTETRNKQYKWIRDEQYNQYRALNLSMTYMVTNLMLKTMRVDWKIERKKIF